MLSAAGKSKQKLKSYEEMVEKAKQQNEQITRSLIVTLFSVAFSCDSCKIPLTHNSVQKGKSQKFVDRVDKALQKLASFQLFDRKPRRLHADFILS